MVVIAVIIDYFIGDPEFLIHPISIIGTYIGFLEKFLNRGKNRKFKGFIFVFLVLLTISIFIIVLQYLIYRLNTLIFVILNIWFLSTALCQKSLFKAGERCKKLLDENEIAKARIAVGMIVGRNTKTLGKEELIKAVVETEAENGVDGIISPIMFMYLGIVLSIWVPFLNPLVTVYIYKAINTMDSMVGYLYEPYKEFGFYAANLDDLANYVPARIGSYLMIFSGNLIGLDGKRAYETYRHDRYSHLSPNAGHPESVIAGLLGVQLGGTHNYNGNIIKKPTIGKSFYKINTNDITETMSIVLLSEVFLVLGWILFIIVATYFISLFTIL